MNITIEGLGALAPIVAPFIIGLLFGIVIKKGLSLLVLGIITIAVASSFGYLNVGIESMREEALKHLPELVGDAQSKLQILPYSTPAFLVGFALGFWRG